MANMTRGDWNDGLKPFAMRPAAKSPPARRRKWFAPGCLLPAKRPVGVFDTQRRALAHRSYPLAGILLCLILAGGIAQAAPQVIRPGEVWHDTAGRIIQAHGAGMLQAGKTYYWFGEDKTQGSPFQNVTCYSSTDLAHWAFCGNMLTRQGVGDLGPNRVVERPKVIFNRTTRTYVMYLHIDSPNYGEAKVGVATSKTVTGPYTYLGSFRPLNHQSRDMTLFQDTDGTDYLVFEDRQRGVCLAELAPDGLSVAREAALIPHAYEAPAVVKVQGLYYLLGSHLSGWNTNPNQYATAPTMAGPWSDFKNVAPPKTKTYDSQTAYILPIRGSKTTSYVYVGDRWKPRSLADSRYIWLPLMISNGAMSVAPDQPWSIDTKTGIIKTKTP
ncbi:MAG: family 43 glycosylhydrolase [Armatimonadota bacterium]|nr:family 43 glycosylhydrolase [Armatimonadota bacterium]